jgi:hypothetical protein
MEKPNDLGQSLSSWLVAGIVPGVERPQPLKKLAVDESALLKLLNRWREEAENAGRRIERIVVASEARRDGFRLARRSAPTRQGIKRTIPPARNLRASTRGTSSGWPESGNRWPHAGSIKLGRELKITSGVDRMMPCLALLRSAPLNVNGERARWNAPAGLRAVLNVAQFVAHDCRGGSFSHYKRHILELCACQGTTHHVTVVADGLSGTGGSHSSLSAIARAIT